MTTTPSGQWAPVPVGVGVERGGAVRRATSRGTAEFWAVPRVLASEYGEHPEAAAERMRLALTLAASV